MPPGVQAKLLRALQERHSKRLGSNEQRPLDCRIIAAANADRLPAPVDGRFRPDLSYRLSVVVLKIPALQERRGDIPVLFNHFPLLAPMR